MLKNNKIAVFGASSKTGLEVINYGVKSGLNMRAVVRSENKIKNFGGNSKDIEVILRDDILNYEKALSAIKGAGAVVTLFGPVYPYKEIFCAKTAFNIVEAMKMENIERLICVTGALIGDYKNNRTLPFNMFCKFLNNKMADAAQDRMEQEKIIKESNLDFTIIKPPRLTDNKFNPLFKSGKGVKAGMFSSVSRKTVGSFIISELIYPMFIKETVFIKN